MKSYKIRVQKEWVTSLLGVLLYEFVFLRIFHCMVKHREFPTIFFDYTSSGLKQDIKYSD